MCLPHFFQSLLSFNPIRFEVLFPIFLVLLARIPPSTYRRLYWTLLPECWKKFPIMKLPLVPRLQVLRMMGPMEFVEFSLTSYASKQFAGQFSSQWRKPSQLAVQLDTISPTVSLTFDDVDYVFYSARKPVPRFSWFGRRCQKASTSSAWRIDDELVNTHEGICERLGGYGDRAAGNYLMTLWNDETLGARKWAEHFEHIFQTAITHFALNLHRNLLGDDGRRLHEIIDWLKARPQLQFLHVFSEEEVTDSDACHILDNLHDTRELQINLETPEGFEYAGTLKAEQYIQVFGAHWVTLSNLLEWDTRGIFLTSGSRLSDLTLNAFFKLWYGGKLDKLRVFKVVRTLLPRFDRSVLFDGIEFKVQEASLKRTITVPGYGTSNRTVKLSGGLDIERPGDKKLATVQFYKGKTIDFFVWE